MSAAHGGPVTQRPVSEIAEYIKKLIPVNLPEHYMLNQRFAHVAEEEDIRSGIIAFRNFLYVFCDRLISDGHQYVRLKKKPKSETDYPFLYQITDLLADIGYYGRLSESGNSLLVTKLPSFTAWTDEEGMVKKPKNSAASLMEGMRFLSLCGFAFHDLDLDIKRVNVLDILPLEVSCPDTPVLLTGLKAMAIADMELRVKRYVSDYNHDNLLRCDYRLLKAEESDVYEVLKDFLHPLPENVQKFAAALHQHNMDMGMTCQAMISTFDIHFAYAYIKNSRKVLSPRDIYQKRVWEFSISVKNGYCLAVRAKKTERYADVIKAFPSALQEKIARGYGCDRKLHNESCQGGCQGIRLPLDDSILDIGQAVERWLDNEISM